MTAPTIVDPKTGELLDMNTINLRLVRLLDELEESGRELGGKVQELGLVTFTFDCTYDRRKAEAMKACADLEWRNGESVARAKARLEVQVRALRDAQHNVRAVLSGIQTLGSNLRSEMSMGGGVR